MTDDEDGGEPSRRPRRGAREMHSVPPARRRPPPRKPVAPPPRVDARQRANGQPPARPKASEVIPLDDSDLADF
jgi:hypothetical protein